MIGEVLKKGPRVPYPISGVCLSDMGNGEGFLS